MERDEMKKITDELETLLEGSSVDSVPFQADAPKETISISLDLDAINGENDNHVNTIPDYNRFGREKAEDDGEAKNRSSADKPGIVEDNELAANMKPALPEPEDMEPERSDLAAEHTGVIQNNELKVHKVKDDRKSKKRNIHLGAAMDTKRKPNNQKRQESFGLIHCNDGLWAAFLVPVVIMIIIFAQRGIFPFGEDSFLRTDLYHQYAPFFSEFKHKLSQGESLLYSWNIGMGINFSALYAYYLASPLNWLLILCPKSYVIEFITYSIVLKIGLSGWAFAYYLRHHGGFEQRRLEVCPAVKDFGIAFFGIFYALSGYMAAYSWNIMWLDCIFLFPLILLGLERMVKEHRGLLYCITLGLSILSNYYISIMICIFMVVYFIALLVLEGRKKISHWMLNLFQFSFFSILSGALAAVVLLPEIAALQMTASGQFDFPKDWKSYFSIFDMIARHLPNVKTEIGLDHWPNLYCGVAVLLLMALYMTCKRISVREKAVYCTLLLFLLASFSINALNFIWHGFHYPNSLPCRQSFIYVALVLLMSYRAYEHLNDIPWKTIVTAFWSAFLFVLAAQKLVTENAFHFSVFYISFLYLSLYTGLLYLYKKKKAGPVALILLTLGLVSVEAAVNTTITSVTTVSRTDYTRDNEYVHTLIGRLKERDTGFYRIEKVERKTKNDGAWLNFPTVSLFSSTANADLTSFFKIMGCESSTNAYSITGSTPVVDMLTSVRYALSTSWDEDRMERRMIDQEGDMYLYENLFTLPLGFLVPTELEMDWMRDLGNPAAVQNALCQTLGVEPALEEAFGETSGNTFHFTANTDGYYYAFVSNSKIEDVTLTIGDWSKTYNNTDRGYLLDIGYCYANDSITLKTQDTSQQLYANIYRVVPENLKSLYETLNRSPLELTVFEETNLKGTVSADRDQTLFTSIPYDKGWTVRLDGEVRTTRKIFDTFLAVDVPEGVHTIEMTYMPQGLRTGAVISGISLSLILLLGILTAVLNRRDLADEELEYEEYCDMSDAEIKDMPIEDHETEEHNAADRNMEGQDTKDQNETQAQEEQD